MGLYDATDEQPDTDRVELMETGITMAPKTERHFFPWRWKSSFLVYLFLAFAYLLIIILIGFVVSKEPPSSELGMLHDEICHNQTSNSVELLRLSSVLSNLDSKLNQLQTSNQDEISRISSVLSNLDNKFNQLQTSNQDEMSRLSSELSNLRNELNQTLASNLAKMFPCGPKTREWEYFDGRCYYFSVETSTWQRAKAQCDAQNSGLVVIGDIAEQNFIQSRTRNGRFWIGLTDMNVEGQWRWIDGTDYTTSFKKWKKGEPNDSDRKEDCAQVHTAGEWNDVPCDFPSFYVCEKLLPS